VKGGTTVVARAEWLRGVVPCPNCGLPLAPQHNRGDYLWTASETQPHGVAGRHTGCGEAFRLEFNDVRGPSQ
jgi:hypothetical protein